MRLRLQPDSLTLTRYMMKASKWAYYARRLRTLRVDEPFHRIKSWVRHGLEKRKFKSNPHAMAPERLWAVRSTWLRTDPRTDASENVNRALLEALPQRWWQDRSFWESFSRLYPEEKNHLISLAEKILNGRFLLFQWKEVKRAKPLQWSETMESETSSSVWRARYYSEIEVPHDPKRPDRDVKWCWELNRFQHLLWLGASWRLTGEDRFAVVAREHVESWLDSVHYPLGVQWSSNLEVALRALSLAWCHVLCLNSPAWDAGFLSRFMPCLYLHGMHLEKELTVHHTQGNHLLGESSALFCISSLYPLFLNASRWRERSVTILNRLVPRVILPDGVYAEQSTGYFRFIAEFLFQVLLVDRGQESRLSDAVAERLAKGLYFIENLGPDIRDVPMIGDSDTGSAIGWRLSDFWDFTPLLATGSVLLGEPELAAPVSSFPAESFLILGEEGLQAFESQKSAAIAEGRAASSVPLLVFLDGGYQRSRDERFSIIFDAGPLGIAPAYGHGHSDGLSFVLHYRGEPVIVDPGTYLYNGPPLWRHYFRSTAAHNTVRIDENDPVEPIGTFRWSGPLKIRPGKPIPGHGWRVLRGAVHWKRMLHGRYVIHVIDQGIIILDRVDGAGEHDVEWRLHFDPRWSVLKKEHAGGTFLCKKVPPAPPSKNSISCSLCGKPHSEQIEVFGEGRGENLLAQGKLTQQLPYSFRHSRESGNPGGPHHVHADTIPGGLYSKSFTAVSGTDRLDVGFVSGHSSKVSVLQGSNDPTAGWYSRYYGAKEPAPTLMVKMKVQLPVTMLTAIKPAGKRLRLPRDVPQALLGPDMFDLLLSDGFSAFADLCE